ncbi:DUF637 domain-containing protein [Pseudoalteromonas luteoviolacea]|uniref:DUF637 domain-containing protein n=1 Tax=Pseudoalteromonas luteoviolacea S4054 TaxID=1129367 RepID=A0A0F6A6T4_9GAMM|nr:DUF637 domain-containing protein [Pseudoalteromonas luteoviolacea]AOT11062.1 hypothetical protein S4054249_24825 [Pseudoalteromonas luteoviolacea]AOT15774.1 hypothetical protein S40542_23685 [Pseudoalteromonas luteoviolacea]AOT20883.1 hypothetical protein S4054_24745 [Pseudoalteromonas luteoviolacea]KKE81922.1 hypothetical protein N479_20720 [Pseudoalteromonas luteoviolacea S4054]KZN71099.1 hypothetical protein N481_19665 [Pseudoalteromonas luteoviolacea S4047-1]
MDNFEFMDKNKIWRINTSCFVLFMFILQLTFPAFAAVLIEDKKIEAHFKSALQYQPAKVNDYSYELNDRIEAVKHVGFVTMEDFVQMLRNESSSTLTSISSAIPLMVGDVTTIIPIYPIEKQIGNEFVQARYIRNQIKDLLSRSLVDGTKANWDTEGEQSLQLYKNSIKFAKSSGKKFGERLAVNDDIADDMIWPEFRRIAGKTTLVPILYLTDETIAKRKVVGNQIDIVGNVSEFNSVKINAGLLSTYRDTVILVAEEFFNKSKIEAHGNLSIVSDVFKNHSGQISVEDSLNVMADHIEHKTVVYRYKTKYGYSDRLGKVAKISAGKNVELISSGDILIEGAEITAGGNILLDAANIVTIKSAPLLSTAKGDSSSSEWHETSLSHMRSTLSAGENVSIFGAYINISGAELTAAGNIELMAQHGVHIVDDIDTYDYQSKGRFGSLSYEMSQRTTVSVRAALDAGKGIVLDTDMGDIKLRAVDIKSKEGTSVTAHTGKIHMLLTKEQDFYSYNTINKGLFTVKMTDEGHRRENAVYNTIVGGVQFDAMYGVHVEYTGDKSLGLQQQLNTLAQMDNLRWLNQLMNNQQLQIDWQHQELLYEEWKTSKTTLSPAAMALLSIAVAIATQGAGTGLLESIGAATTDLAVAMTQAAVSTLASSAATSLANGNSLSETLEQMTSSDGLRSLAVAVVTAGALQQVSEMLGQADSFLHLGAESSFVEQAYQAVVKATVRAGISSGLTNASFNEVFVGALAQTAIAAFGKHTAQKLKKLGSNGDLAHGFKYIGHAAAGCVQGIAKSQLNKTERGQGCSSGASGAVIGEFIGEVYHEKVVAKHAADAESALITLENRLSRTKYANYSGKELAEKIQSDFEYSELRDISQDFIDDLNQSGVNLARFGSALAAFGAGMDVNIAADTGENAAQNNALFFAFIPLVLKVIDASVTAYELYQIQQVYEDSGREEGDKALKKYMTDLLGDKAIEMMIPGGAVWNKYLKDKVEGLSPEFSKQVMAMGDLSFANRDKSGDAPIQMNVSKRVGELNCQGTPLCATKLDLNNMTDKELVDLHERNLKTGRTSLDGEGIRSHLEDGYVFDYEKSRWLRGPKLSKVDVGAKFETVKNYGSASDLLHNNPNVDLNSIKARVNGMDMTYDQVKRNRDTVLRNIEKREKYLHSIDADPSKDVTLKGWRNERNDLTEAQGLISAEAWVHDSYPNARSIKILDTDFPHSGKSRQYDRLFEVVHSNGRTELISIEAKGRSQPSKVGSDLGAARNREDGKVYGQGTKGYDDYLYDHLSQQSAKSSSLYQGENREKQIGLKQTKTKLERYRLHSGNPTRLVVKHDYDSKGNARIQVAKSIN